MPHLDCPASTDPRLVGDPVDAFNGALLDRLLDFRLTGPLEFWWLRHYNSAYSHRRLALGWGHTHDFDRTLRFDVDGISYQRPVAQTVGFLPLTGDGEESTSNGFVLRRLSALRYQVHHHGEPSMEFEFRSPTEPARLKRLFQGDHQIQFQHNAARRLERILDSAGRAIRVVEETSGRILSLTLEGDAGKPDTLLIAYEYDERGNLVATTNASGQGYKLAYDDANRLVRRTGRMGFTFRFEYDSQGRCVKSTGDGRLQEVSLEYEIPGRVTKVTRADGGVWTYFFDEAGGLTQILDPLGGVQKFVRDESGRVTLEVDPNGNATRLVYDAAGSPVAKITPLGHTRALPEDPNAPDPLAHRVPANPAEYEYGRLLDLKAITLPDRYEAAALSLPFEARPLLVTRPETKPEDRLAKTFQARPLGAIWWPDPDRGRVFNDLGKLVRQEDEFGRLRHWSYDTSGNVTQHTDFDGGKWSYDYGSWHLRGAETNPAGARVQFSYTPSEELASFTDAGGTRSEYGYNLKNDLTEVRRHGVVRETYTRDLAGNLVAKHASDGRLLLTWERGPGNLPIKRTLASGDEHTFEYDKAGRHLAAATKKDRVEFAYDALGNCSLEKRNGAGVEHRFRGWQTPAESVFFGRFIVRTEARTSGTRVITDPGGKKHRICFLPHGLVERHFCNGSQETAQYDVQGRCLFKYAQRVTGPVWKRRYHWSGEGELRRVEDNLRGELGYEYDAVHRLRSRALPGGKKEDYEFDAADNLLRKPGVTGLSLGTGNRLGTANGEAFEHNDRNHIAGKKSAGDQIRYHYDSRDMLARAEINDAPWEAHYDALGRRTRKTWGGQTTEYFWDGDRLMAEVHADGRLRLYVYADPLAMTPLMFLDYDSIDAPADSGRRYFIFTDQIGTPVLVEDESGAEVWSARIEPYGQAHISSGAKIEFNLRFPGHYFDSETGLHYNRFRYYDPHLGRYLQSDPWGISGGYNLYAYRPNPLLEVDVRGLGPENDPKCKKPEDGAEGTIPAAGGDKDPYRRPSGFRKGVRDTAWDAAVEASTGRVRDPVTGRFISKNKPWEMGHRPGYEFRKHRDSARARGIGREQFLDEHNEPSHYRPELKESNGSHAGEDHTDDYLGD